MATVATLVEHVLGVTGLSDGAEETLVEAYLNDIALRAVEESGCYTASYSWTLTAGTTLYQLSASPLSTSDALMFLSMRATGNGATDEIVEQDSEESVRRDLQGSNALIGVPTKYALIGDNYILFNADPSGVTVAGMYVKEPLLLVQSGATPGTSETTPTCIRKRFHFEVLANGAIAMAFEYDGDDRAADYWSKYGFGLANMAKYHAQFGGLGGAPLGGSQLGPRRYRDSY